MVIAPATLTRAADDGHPTPLLPVSAVAASGGHQ
jgi:hypothetical protein